MSADVVATPALATMDRLWGRVQQGVISRERAIAEVLGLPVHLTEWMAAQLVDGTRPPSERYAAVRRARQAGRWATSETAAIGASPPTQVDLGARLAPYRAIPTTLPSASSAAQSTGVRYRPHRAGAGQTAALDPAATVRPLPRPGAPPAARPLRPHAERSGRRVDHRRPRLLPSWARPVRALRLARSARVSARHAVRVYGLVALVAVGWPGLLGGAYASIALQWGPW